MIVNKAEGNWTIGNTSFNVSVERSQLFYSLFLSSLLEFKENNNNNSLSTSNKIIQRKLFSFWNENNEYKILAKNKDKDATVRKKTNAIKSYGLIDSNWEITFLGDLYLNNLSFDFFKKINSEYKISCQNIAMIIGSCLIESNNKDQMYNPILDFFKILQKKDIFLESFFASRYSSSKEEFYKILNFENKDELKEYLLSELSKSNLDFLKNRKTNNDSPKEIFNLVKEDIENYIKSKDEIYKKSMEKIILSKLKNFPLWMKSFQISIKENLFSYFKFDIKKTLLSAIRYNSWISNSYSQQLKILSFQTKLFDIKNNKISATYKINFIDFNIDFKSFNSTNIEKNIEQMFINKENINNKWKEIKKNYIIDKMFEISKERDILIDLISDDFYEIKNYPQEITSLRKYVLLEYFIAILLSKKINVDVENIFNGTLYEDGSPMSHAPGKNADLIIEKYNLLIEATLSFGRSSEKLEIEPIIRHLANIKNKNNKNFKTIFIAHEPINTNMFSFLIPYRNKKYYLGDNDNYIDNLVITILSIKDFNEIISLPIESFLKKLDEIENFDNLESKKIEANKWVRSEYDKQKNRIIQSK